MQSKHYYPLQQGQNKQTDGCMLLDLLHTNSIITEALFPAVVVFMGKFTKHYVHG